jgi:uncharacterized protein
MASYRSPGVYNVEVDDSLYATGASTSVAGMAGVTVKGPVGEPVLVTSWPQFFENFGGYTPNSWLPQAAKAFFEEGGSVLYVSRVVHFTDIDDRATDTSETASLALTDGEVTPALSLTVEAKSPGTWGNALFVAVTTSLNGEFSLEVRNAAGDVLERFTGLGALPLESNFVETVINPSSLYIKVVHAQGVPAEAAAAALAGGDDGLTSLTDTDYVGSPAARNGFHAFDSVDTIKLFATPGVPSTTVQTALAAYAEKRSTGFAILGSSAGLNATQAAVERGTLASGYAAYYWPRLIAPSMLTGHATETPVEGHIMGMIARSDDEARVWGAPAGLQRGRIRTALGVAYDSTQGERDELYEKQVNALAVMPGSGVVVWGQRVLLAKPSALDRINVRRTLNFVKEVARDSAKYLLFEPNDERTWNAFIRFVDPFLANIKEERGLYDYLVKCDHTTNTPYYLDRNQMVAKLFIKPTKTAEFIEIQYIVTGSGADFSEL